MGECAASRKIQRLWLALTLAVVAVFALVVAITIRGMRKEATTAIATAEVSGGPYSSAAPPSSNNAGLLTTASAVAPDGTAANSESDTTRSGNSTAPATAAPIDRDHALGLMADLVARQKVSAGDSADDNWRREFDAAPLNPALTAEFRSTLYGAFADLSGEARSHFIVGDVVCRAEDCEMLAAVNGAVERQAQSGAWEAHAAFGIGDLVERVGRTPWSRRGHSTTYEERRMGDDGYLVYRVVFKSVKAK